MWVAINNTVLCAFGHDVVSENMNSVHKLKEEGRQKFLEEATQINPLEATLSVFLMDCTQSLTLSHGPPWDQLHSLETSRQD